MSEVYDALKLLSKELNIQFSAEVAVPGEEVNFSDVRLWVPTTSYILNLVLGGGIPMGRILEVYGEPSHGKSTIITHMMVGCQKFPGISVLLDAESSWYRDRALAMGHDPSRHLHLQADTVELGFSVIASTITRIRMKGSRFPPKMPVCFFWDTIAASPTEGEKEGDQYRDGMSDKARKIRMNLRKLSLVLPKSNCALVFVNQTITDIKAKNPKFNKTTPGGGAIKFWASKRIKVYKISRMQYPHDNSGIISTLHIVKDKINPPNREGEVPILNATGIHPVYELLNFLVDNSDYVNLIRKQYVITDYPTPGSDMRISQSKLDEHLTKLGSRQKDLIEYLQCCVDEAWAAKYGGLSD